MMWPEILIVAAAVVLLGGYHLFFLYEIKKSPHRTVVGTAREQRAAWVARIVSRGDGILAVQTLRNWVMTASFLASTAILIAVGLLGVLVSADKFSLLIHQINVLGSQSDYLVTVKLLLLIANFFLAFFNFSLSLRFYNYVALAINTVDDQQDTRSSGEVVSYLDRGAAHYTFGMRGFYLAIPLVFWLFGPLWLLIGAIVIMVALYLHDHPPRLP